MATKNYTFPTDGAGNDYQPDLVDNADITVAFSDFTDGIQTVFTSLGTDITSIDNKLDGTSNLSIPATKFILQGAQSANTAKFAVTNTGSTAVTFSLPTTSSTLLGDSNSQTISNKTLGSGNSIGSGVSITNGGTISGGTIASATITSPTISNPTIGGSVTLQSGATVSGGTFSSTSITSPAISNPTITGSVTGDQDFNGNVNIDGTLNAGATDVDALTINGVAVVNGFIPTPGMIVMYGGATVPTGWLLCNGQTTAGYTALAAVVGAIVPDLRDRFIVGAGTSYALKAAGGSTTTSDHAGHGHTVSATTGTGTTDNGGADHSHSAAHDHNITGGSHNHGLGGSVSASTGGFKASSGNTSNTFAPTGHTHSDNFAVSNDPDHAHNVVSYNGGTGLSNAWSHSHGQNAMNVSGNAATGGTHSHTVTPPYYALYYIIKT